MTQPGIHPQSVCLAKEVGENTEVGVFSNVSEGVRLGKNVVIGSRVSIGRDAVIGEGSVIDDGAILAPGVVVGSHSQIGPGAVFAPGRSAHTGEDEKLSKITVGSRCVIGANATLCAGVVIGDHSIVDAGSVLTRSVHPYSIMAGNPATVVGFSGAKEGGGVNAVASKPVEKFVADGVRESIVRGVRVHRLPFISDPRGNLTVGEFERSVPFVPKRFFMTFDVPGAHLRGEHAHKICDQYLICVKGSCAVVVDDGSQREEFQLDSPTIGIFVPRMIWATEYKHSADSVLLVFASEFYDPDDYLRDYEEFLDQVKQLDSHPPKTNS